MTSNSVQQPLVNVLTRTSNRPTGIERNINSIKSQTYNNINHIIGTDDLNSIDNVKRLTGKDPIFFDREEIIQSDPNKPGADGKAPHPHLNTGRYSPQNLYLNILNSKVESGYILYLDDDDYIAPSTAIEEIVNHILTVGDEDVICYFQMERIGRDILPRVPPSPPKMAHIGGSCLMFHSKYKHLAEWDSWKCSDFRVITRIHDNIKRFLWIQRPYIKVPKEGLGQRIDI